MSYVYPHPKLSHRSVWSVGSQHESEEIVHFQESSILHTIYGQ